MNCKTESHTLNPLNAPPTHTHTPHDKSSSRKPQAITYASTKEVKILAPFVLCMLERYLCMTSLKVLDRRSVLTQYLAILLKDSRANPSLSKTQRKNHALESKGS